MQESDRKRLVELMRDAITGHKIGKRDQAFLERMFRGHPEQYGRLHDEAREWSIRYVRGECGRWE